MFKNCKNIFDVVRVLNEHVKNQEVYLVYVPVYDKAMHLPVDDEPLLKPMLKCIKNIQVTDLWDKDDEAQEVMFDGEVGTFPTDMYSLVKEGCLTDKGLSFEYMYDAYCLNNKRNKEYILQNWGNTYEFKCNIFVGII